MRKPEPAPTIPDWLLAPISVSDVMPDKPTVRDAVAQALEYQRAAQECAARLDYIRELQED